MISALLTFMIPSNVDKANFLSLTIVAPSILIVPIPPTSFKIVLFLEYIQIPLLFELIVSSHLSALWPLIVRFEVLFVTIPVLFHG